MKVYIHDALVVRAPVGQVDRLEMEARRVRLEAIEAEQRGEVLAVDAYTTRDGAVRLITATVPKPNPGDPPSRGRREPWTDPEGWRR